MSSHKCERNFIVLQTNLAVGSINSSGSQIEFIVETTNLI